MNKLINYFNGILKKYHNIRSELKNIPAYAIYDIKKNNGKYLLIVKVNGTGKTIPYSLQEIFDDENVLNEFSFDDKRTIYRLDSEEQSAPIYCLTSIQFCESSQSVIFCLKNKKSGKIEEIPIDKVSQVKEIITQCSPLDAFRIGYSQGIEQSKN